MKALHKAYEELLGKPDSLIQLKSEDDSIVFDLAVSNPIPDDDLPDSSVTSLGLSALSDKKNFSIEFFTEIHGKVSKETVNALGEVYHTLFDLLVKDKRIVPGTIYRSVSLPPFDKMDAVMITEKGYADIQWLDEENEKGRLIQLIPLFEKEADELEQFLPELRTKLMVRSKLSYTNPKRKEAEISHDAFLTIWKSIAAWYKENKVTGASLLEKVLKSGAESNTAAALEKKLKFELPKDFKASFNMMHEQIMVEDFTLLDEKQIITHMDEMNDLNNKGAFKKGLKKIRKDKRVQEQWWHEKWIPVAINSYGDRICIDMAPGKEGVEGQVIMHYNEEGPMASGYTSFFDYLDDYDTKLNAEEYEVSESGNLKQI